MRGSPALVPHAEAPIPNRLPRQERPNTVAGLEAKRAELRKLRDQLEADLRAVTCDLDHLDAAIRLFDPQTTPAATKRYTARHRARKGSVRRFILAALLEATEPITTKHLTERWLAERGLRTDDATWAIIRNRLGACMNNLQIAGLAKGAGMVDGIKGGGRLSTMPVVVTARRADVMAAPVRRPVTADIMAATTSSVGSRRERENRQGGQYQRSHR